MAYTVRFTWERLTYEQFLGRFPSIADQPVWWGLTRVSAERKLETLFPEIDSPALRSELWSLTFTASIAFISSPPPQRSCSLTDWITNQVPFGNKLQFWEWRLMMTDCLSVAISLLTSCHGISFPPVRVYVFSNKSTLLTNLINSNLSIFAARSSFDVLPLNLE